MHEILWLIKVVGSDQCKNLGGNVHTFVVLFADIHSEICDICTPNHATCKIHVVHFIPTLLCTSSALTGVTNIEFSMAPPESEIRNLKYKDKCPGIA